MMATSLQLRTLLATDARQEYRLVDYALARTVTTLLALLAVIAVCLAAQYSWMDTHVVLLVALVKAVESVREIFYGYFQNSERLQRIAISTIAKGAAMVVGAAVGGWATEMAWGAVIGMLVGIVLVTLAVDLPTVIELVHSLPAANNDENSSAPSWIKTKRLLIMGICPGAIVGLNSLTLNIPRYIIDYMMGTVPLGIFTGLASMMRIGTYVELALVQATQAKLSQFTRDGKTQSYRRMLGRTVIVAVMIGVVVMAMAWLVGGPVLTIAFSSQYAQYANSLVVLLLASALGHVAGVLKGATDASRRYAVQLPIFAVSVTVAVISGLVLVPQWGILGAAWSMVATKTAITVGYVLVLAYQPSQTSHAVCEGSQAAIDREIEQS
jgi:O-antigen/teichoic acid export membrane protein